MGTITGKLKGVIAAITPSGRAEGEGVDVGGDVGGHHPREVDGQARRELDGLEAAHDLGERVGVGLAVVAGDERGELLAVLPELLAPGEEDLAAGDEGHVAPGREGGLRRGHGARRPRGPRRAGRGR